MAMPAFNLLGRISLLAESGMDFFALLPVMMFQLVLLFAFWIYAKRVTVRHYREYLYLPLDPTELPRRTRDRFDQYAVDFCRLGFEKVQDMRLQEKPYRHDLRLFLSARGDIWGEINVAKNFWTIVKCVSVFDDGMKIETASTPPLRQPELQDRLQWNDVLGGSVEEIYRKHREAVAHYQAKTGAAVLTFAPEDAQDVLTYGLRLYWHWFRRMGLAKEPIPEAILPHSPSMAALSQPLVR